MNEKKLSVEESIPHLDIDSLIPPLESQVALAPQHAELIAKIVDQTDKQILEEVVAFIKHLATNKRQIIDIPDTTWFQAAGFSAGVIDTPVHIVDFEKIVYVQDKLSQNFDAVFGVGSTSTENHSITIRKFIELLRPLLIAELYTQAQLVTATELLHTYLPATQLQYPVELVPDFSLSGQGCYMGMFRKKHYILINPFSLIEAPYLPVVPSRTSLRQQSDTSAIAHELIHAFHAEQAGVANVVSMVAEFDTFPELQQLDSDASPSEVVAALIDARNNPSHLLLQDGESDNPESLVLLLCEGIATLAQIYILNQQISASEDNSKEREVLTKLRRYLLLETRYRTTDDQQMVNGDRPGHAAYAEGTRFVHRLIKLTGIDNLSNIIPAIDYTACTKISPGSDEYKQIIKDPTKLPGLAGMS